MTTSNRPFYWTAPVVPEGERDAVALIQEARDLLQRQCGVPAEMIVPPGHSYSTRLTIDAWLSQFHKERTSA